jgi:hypothetical protein
MVSDESHFKVLCSQTKTHYTEIHPHSCAIFNRGWWQDQKVLEASICVRVSQRVKLSCSTIGFMQHIRKWTLFTHQASCAQKIPSSHLCLQISAGKEHTINIVHDSNSKGLDKCSDIWCEVGHGHSVEKNAQHQPICKCTCCTCGILQTASAQSAQEMHAFFHSPNQTIPMGHV